MKQAIRSWVFVAITSVTIHVVFCTQAFLALAQGGMASEGPWLLIFFPHYLLMYFLPPAYPITFLDGIAQVNYTAFWGKMLVAAFASVAYAIVIAGVVAAWARSRKPPIKEDTGV